MNTGAKDVLYKTRYFLIPYLIMLCFCLVIKVLFSREQLFFAVNKQYNDWADLIAPYITDIGDGITVFVLSLLLALFNYRSSFLLITSYAVTSIMAQILKFSFNMPRPVIYFSNQLGKIHFVKDLYILSTNSFPSGNTVTIFSAGIVITYLVRHKMWGLILFAVAVLVGYSRMYLSQHFFDDVLAGSVIGVIITVLWISWIDRRKFLSNPQWKRGLLKK